MPVAIIPDISERHSIGCALCVEICTALGPDVLRVKPVEGWKRGKAFVFYPERCISDGALHWRLPNKGNILDEANGLYTRTTNSIEEERSFRKRLGRRLNNSSQEVLNSFF